MKETKCPPNASIQVDYDLRVAKRTTWLKAEHRVRVHAD
jgi:hypothetical protein